MKASPGREPGGSSLARLLKERRGVAEHMRREGDHITE